MDPLIGIVVGDSLGLAFESMGPKTDAKYPRPSLEEWDGETFYGSAYLGTTPGQYSDDSQMSLALAQSIINAGEYNPTVAANHYLAWAQSAGARGMGGTVRKAMDNLAAGISAYNSGIPGVPSTGAAMRVIPLGVLYRNELAGELIRAVRSDAEITHRHPIAVDAALLFALLTQQVCKYGVGDLRARKNTLAEAAGYMPRGTVLEWAHSRLEEETPEESAEDVPWTEYRALDAVWGVCGAFLMHDTYEDAVRYVIRRSHDTDTEAAIIGGIMACDLPVPERWKVQVEGWQELEKVQEALLAVKPR